MPVTDLSAEDRIRKVFSTSDDGDVDANVAQMTEDLVFRFGSAEPLYGREAYRRLSEEFLGQIRGLRHEIVSLWNPEPDVVITEIVVHYTRLDGSEISLPCSNVFRLRDGLVAEYLIFMDVNPLFGDAA